MLRALPRYLIALLLAAALTVPAAAKDWLRAETDDFIIYSDGFPHALERWAKKIERFDTLLRMRFDRPQDGRGKKLVIYMLEDADAVADFTGRKNLAGVYVPSSEGSFMISHRAPAYRDTKLSGQMTLFHEYAHHFTYRNFPAAYPAWYREGFADYVSTVTFDAEGRYTFGTPAGHREKQTRKNRLPIKTILSADVSEFEPDERATFYAWSWLLVHMLNSDPASSARLAAYLEAFANGDSPQNAAAVLGNPKRLEQQLRAYKAAPPGSMDTHDPIPFEGEIRITELGSSDSQLVTLSLSRKLRRNMTETREGLRRLAQAEPGNVRVLMELALLERDVARKAESKDYRTAEAAIDQALSIDPSHARANLVKADLMIRRLEDGAGSGSSDWLTAREHLARAIRSDPEDSLALMTLFRSYLAAHEKPTPAAYQGMRKAFALQPESREVRLSYAFSLALGGKFEEATKVVEMLAFDPHSSEVGRKALASLERMQARAGEPSD